MFQPTISSLLKEKGKEKGTYHILIKLELISTCVLRDQLTTKSTIQALVRATTRFERQFQFQKLTVPLCRTIDIICLHYQTEQQDNDFPVSYGLKRACGLKESKVNITGHHQSNNPN